MSCYACEGTGDIRWPGLWGKPCPCSCTRCCECGKAQETEYDEGHPVPCAECRAEAAE